MPHAGPAQKKDPKTGRFFKKKVHMTDPADEEGGQDEDQEEEDSELL